MVGGGAGRTRDGPTFEHVGLLHVFSRDMIGKGEEITALGQKVDDLIYTLLEIKDDVGVFELDS